jgi:guanylate kinase
VRISVSATTRSPRPGEVDGKSYHFLTREQFEELEKRGDFFESEEVHGNFYGTLRATVEDSIRDGVDLLLDIDIRGALRFKAAYGRFTVLNFVVPPTFEILRDRLKRRAGSTPEDLKKRIATARKEYQVVRTSSSFTTAAQSPEVDYLIVNDDFNTAYGRLLGILQAERLRMSRLSAEEVERICSVPVDAEGSL